MGAFVGRRASAPRAVGLPNQKAVDGRRVEQAAEKARPVAGAEDVRRETLGIGKFTAAGRDSRRRSDV